MLSPPKIPRQVAPLQSLPPLHRTTQCTLQINTKSGRKKVFIKSLNLGMDTKVWSNSNRMSRKYRSFRCCHRRNNRSLPPNSFVRGDTPLSRKGVKRSKTPNGNCPLLPASIRRSSQTSLTIKMIEPRSVVFQENVEKRNFSCDIFGLRRHVRYRRRPHDKHQQSDQSRFCGSGPIKKPPLFGSDMLFDPYTTFLQKDFYVETLQV